MIGSPHSSTSAVNDDELFRFVASALAKIQGSSAHLHRLDRRLYDYHSSFAIEELTAHFSDDSKLALIFKNLSRDGLLEEARRVRPHFAYQPQREIIVYRDILANARLGTASCYGILLDLEGQRFWLLLEKVAGEELYQIEQFSVWCDVARWLAGMHAQFADSKIIRERDTSLLSFDESFCNQWIDRTERFVLQRDPTDRSLPASATIEWLIDRCRIAARYVGRLPVTFIHGEFYASNILIMQQGNRTRICPVDWETAAIGPGLIDLAALISGDWTEAEKEHLATAYLEALAPASVWGDRHEFTTALACCRLLLAIKWLGWSPDWQPPEDHRRDWLAEAILLAQEIDSSVPAIEVNFS